MSAPATNAPAGPEPIQPGAFPGRIERLLLAWLALITTMALGGYGLALAGHLASLPGWIAVLAASVVASGLCLFRPRRPAADRPAPATDATPTWPEWILIGALAALFLGNLVIVLGSAPGCWDVLTYHLARVGYYLQQGNLDDFHANYWAQEQHGRLSAILFAGTMVLTGNTERAVGLWQLAAWVALMLEGFALSRLLGLGLRASRIAGGCLGLLVVGVMEASTAQNDLLIASCLGLSLISLTRGLQTGSWVATASAAIAAGVAFGIKASALTLAPAMGVLAVGIAWQVARTSGQVAWTRLAGLSGATALALTLACLPAGYYKNWRNHGHPLGGDAVLKHADSGGPWLQHTARNAARYAFDFFTADGLPESWGGSLGSRLKAKTNAVLKSAGVDLESPLGARAPFAADRPRFAHNDRSFFGLLGPCLLLPALCLGIWPGRPVALRWFALAAILFFITQAGMGRYDFWRGRHFLYGTVLLAPLLAAWHDRAGRIGRGYFGVIAAAGILSAGTALLWRDPFGFLSRPGQPALLSLNRLDQMAGLEASIPALQRFDQIVPPDAHVALALRPDEHEYALFGPRLSRHLHPVTHTLPALKIPSPCAYLLYDPELGITPDLGDVHLGYRWYLRQLPATGTIALRPMGMQPADEPQMHVDQTLVQRLHAPGRMQWSLQGDETAFAFDFGFVPEAYDKGASNGVIFLVELLLPSGAKQVLFERMLDPVRHTSDRGSQSGRVALSKITPGTQLLLRTDPGPFGDNAWDWSYVSRLRIERARD